MKIKINEKIICIPPYVSTTWESVSSLQSEEDSETKKLTLLIHMMDGKVIRIPNLESTIVEVAFSAHMRYLEQAPKPEGEQKLTFGSLLQQITGLSPNQIASMPIRFGIGGLPGLEGIEMAFQHNPAQADIPDVPKEALDKITNLAKMMTNGDLSAFSKPEPHCNCMYCQLARSLHGIQKQHEPVVEELISEEDLKLRTWDITQSGDKLFTVTNPEDPKENYRVFLGAPVGCTCGLAHCEHIKAVLYS